MRKLVMAALATGALAACDVQPGTGPEVGLMDNAGFGNATMNNVLTQSGQADYRIDLARRFAAEVPTTINFAFDSAVLDAEAQRVLRRQADWIRQFPELRFRVYGHTDLVGSAAYNQRLGQRRADAAVAYLLGLGVERARLEGVVSRGETQPLIVTEGRERANRRTVTEVTGFVQNHPGVLNGRYAEIIFRDYVASAATPSPETGPAATQLSGD